MNSYFIETRISAVGREKAESGPGEAGRMGHIGRRRCFFSALEIRPQAHAWAGRGTSDEVGRSGEEGRARHRPAGAQNPSLCA